MPVTNANSSSPAVAVRDLTKQFGQFFAVDKVSFEVPRGEIFGFLGPNGAGKSTTIRMLCGILAPSAGSGSVAGFDVLTQAEQIKANIGYMSQRFSLYEDLTVEENLNFFSGVYRIAAQKKQQRKDWVIAMAGLEQHRNTLAGRLSGGWKQRLALGCAILHEPPILFLDEPTSGVDPISRRQFWDLIYDMSARGVTIFVTTHYMDEAEYCDRLGLIYRGQLIAIGSGRELKERFMAEEVLEVACPRAWEVLESVEKLPGVKEASLFGQCLHVVCADGLAAKAAIGAFLQQHHLVGQVEKIVPSLEDVFVSLIEAHDRRNDTMVGGQR